MKSNNKNKTALVFGVFNTLHLGHLRFLKFAAEQADHLVVAVYSNEYGAGASLTDSERVEALRAVSFIDEIRLLKGSKIDFIQTLRPDVIVKGKEFEKLQNDEREIADSFGIKLVFGSGEPLSSPIDDQAYRKSETHVVIDERVRSYIRRNRIQKKQCESLLTRFANARVLVLGDVIIDEYVDCDPVGLSQEDPTIVVNPKSKNVYLGGAGIVAAHAAGLGAKVTFGCVTGNDAGAQKVEQFCGDYGLNLLTFRDPTRPTTTKRRYRSISKTLLRVNEYRQHDISEDLKQKFLKEINATLSELDLIIFSDFNYGFLCNGFIKQLIESASELGIPMFADSQSSSQVGDLAKFNGMKLITPTEYEARITIQNKKDGLVSVSEQLGRQLGAQNVFVTLGEDGVLIRHLSASSAWETDELPALNPTPVDVAGAGDAMFTAASLCIASGATIWEAALIGSLASACQVSRVGNVPLQVADIKQQLEISLS